MIFWEKRLRKLTQEWHIVFLHLIIHLITFSWSAQWYRELKHTLRKILQEVCHTAGNTTQKEVMFSASLNELFVFYPTAVSSFRLTRLVQFCLPFHSWTPAGLWTGRCSAIEAVFFTSYCFQIWWNKLYDEDRRKGYRPSVINIPGRTSGLK